MGRPKVLLETGGYTLLDRAIVQARQLSASVTVATGASYPLVRFRGRVQPSRWLPVDSWMEGMSASLRAGLVSLGPEARGVFVLLADQPLLDANALVAMSAAARCVPDQAVAADYGNRPGVPAYLPRWLWPQVMALDGDRGASAVLQWAGATRVGITGVFDDVDSPGDWQAVRKRLSQTDLTTRQSRP
ncbi:nucleotidyltransferase family protein [Marinobacter sp. NP-4(2019)]|uniref:nucleotidyltransferase family protein n=1 Tax=Marinobacter sp. NP-4(2019) TaxID=2488665 RepID=UPI000FC3D89A|nr:nucleotidyltransferase family protein [Marinobacter sp. NP-4(2019)]AZT84353.1 nucleotidyltransferase family protein [Marinobacter sp. NP-4(2019)]